MAGNMIGYSIKTLFRGFSLLLAVVVVTFCLVESSPIDPVEAYIGAEHAVTIEQKEAIAEYWGLNASASTRLWRWMSALAHGDMGTSMHFQQPVTQIIKEYCFNSILLMGVAWILSGILGFSLGIIAAANYKRPTDTIIKTYCLVVASAPVFWLGLLILMVFAVWLGWFPIALGAPIGKTANEVTFMDRLHHLVLPAVTLAMSGVSQIALHTRQKLIDVLQTKYVLFASTRGESKWQIIRRHGIRNILLPAVTLQFASINALFSGSVLAETVFSYAGLGSVMVTAGIKGDVPLLLGVTMVGAIFVFVGNTMANLLYPVIDPQIREGST